MKHGSLGILGGVDGPAIRPPHLADGLRLHRAAILRLLREGNGAEKDGRRRGLTG